jgi:hypothetical protein
MRARLQAQTNRFKDALEKAQNETCLARMKDRLGKFEFLALSKKNEKFKQNFVKKKTQ